MPANKENPFQLQSDDAAPRRGSDPDKGSKQKKVPEWMQQPQLENPVQEGGVDDYLAEEFRPEPSKYNAVKKKRKSARASGQRRRSVSRSVLPSEAPRHLAPISRAYGGRTHNQRRKKRGSFMVVLILLAVVFVIAYQHSASLRVLATRWLEQLSTQIEQLEKQLGQDDDEASITALTDDDATGQAPLVLSKMGCHDLMPRAERLGDLSSLEVDAQFAIAECYYLRGDYLNSYRILKKNEKQLSDAPLLLFTILLLKRKHFDAAARFLKGKCQHSGSEERFFPCLAQSLQQMAKSGDIVSAIRPVGKHNDNSYSAIAWLLLALQQKDYDVVGDYMSRATTVGIRTNRRVALSWVYETLMRYTYRYGNEEMLKRLYTVTIRQLQDEHTAASWWVRFLAKLKMTKERRREILHSISSKDNLLHLRDNLDFLTIISIESIAIGNTDTLEIVINRIRSYQKSTWDTVAKGALQFLDSWKIRVAASRNHHRQVMNSLQDYAHAYGNDHFYYFFRGLALMRMIGKSGTQTPPSSMFLRSISRRGTWENNYAYAVALLHGGQAKQLAGHMPKLKQLATTVAQKNWLKLLRAEIKISAGKHHDAIQGLRAHIRKYPRSFAAHRLLIIAYQRAQQKKEAGVVRKVYDRLQKRVPYYSTEEGQSAPLGPFAML